MELPVEVGGEGIRAVVAPADEEELGFVFAEIGVEEGGVLFNKQGGAGLAVGEAVEGEGLVDACVGVGSVAVDGLGGLFAGGLCVVGGGDDRGAVEFGSVGVQEAVDEMKGSALESSGLPDVCLEVGLVGEEAGEIGAGAGFEFCAGVEGF